MLDGSVISTFIPGASTDAAFTGFSGIFACLTLESGIVNPLTTISAGGGAEHSLSLQVTASPNTVASRRDKYKSGFPLSTQARTRSVAPFGRGKSTLMTARLWSMAAGTVTDFGSDCGADFSCATQTDNIRQAARQNFMLQIVAPVRRSSDHRIDSRPLPPRREGSIFILYNHEFDSQLSEAHWHRRKSESSAAAGFTRCPDLPRLRKYVSRPHSARLPTPTSAARSKIARLRFWPAMAADIASCPVN